MGERCPHCTCPLDAEGKCLACENRRRASEQADRREAPRSTKDEMSPIPGDPPETTARPINLADQREAGEIPSDDYHCGRCGCLCAGGVECTCGLPTVEPVAASTAAFHLELAEKIWEEEIPVSAAILASEVVDARIHGTLLHTLDVKTEQVERLQRLVELRERQMGLAAKFIGRYYEVMRTPASPVNEVIDARQMVYAIGADLKNILEVATRK